MHHRPFRLILLLSLLISLVVLPGILIVRAKAPSTHAGRSFQPTGHVVVVPQRINTATLKQSKLTLSSSNSMKQSVSTSTSIKPSSLPYPPNVVNVPAPTTTDSTAKTALSTKTQPKPDATGAGGVNNYLETTEGGLAVYTRSGTQQLVSTYQSWFKLPNTQFVNPVTTWDDTGDRFIFSILQQGTAKVLLSVAQQSDATGSYCNYSYGGLAYHDFDHLGVDADGIYFSANVLSPKTGQVVNNELFYASRTALETCQTTTFAYWDGLTNPDGTIAKSIAPAREDSSVPGVEYLVNSFPAGACQLTLWTLTSGSVLSNSTVGTQCYSPPPQARQKGSTTLIGTGDCSITQASVVNGLLTVDTPGAYNWQDGRGVVSIVEWFVLNPSTATVANQGAFGTPSYWLFYPSAITTPNGNMLFVYSASGPGIYPSVWYVDQTMTDPAALANGVSYYTYTGAKVSPWGAYQSAWPDTSSISANSVWITGEYAKATNVWGTKYDLITPA